MNNMNTIILNNNNIVIFNFDSLSYFGEFNETQKQEFYSKLFDFFYKEVSINYCVIVRK